MEEKLRECSRCGSVVSKTDEFCRVCNEPQTEVVSGETVYFDESEPISDEPSPPIVLPALKAKSDREPEPASAATIQDQGPAGDTPLKDPGYLEISEKELSRESPDENTDLFPPPIPREPPEEKETASVVPEPRKLEERSVARGSVKPMSTRREKVKIDPGSVKVYKIKAGDFDKMVDTCRALQQSDYDLYGLFGRPEAGKSSFIYALKEHFKSGTDGFGGFTTEGEGWDNLAREMEEYWTEGRATSTDKDHYYIYQAANHEAKRHIAIIDIAGEHFEGLKWSEEVLDFFGAYLGRCKGFFMLMELDESAYGHATDAGAKRKSRQMESIVSFLSVAATVGEIRDAKDRDTRLDAIDKARQGVGKSRVKASVALCLSKADRISGMRFGDHGRIMPGDGTAMGDPWNVVDKLWPGHFKTLLKLAPHLKIEWVSCLGPGFDEKRRFSGSWGMKSVMRHVVLDPPPKWALPAYVYRRLRKWIRV